jgi:hypothetical protein
VTLERTLQQRDPLAAIVGRPTTYIASLGVPIYAGVMLWLNRADIDNLGLASASLALTATTGFIFAFASSPLRAPVTVRLLVTVTGLTWFAGILGAASMWQSNGSIRDDWGPTVVALFLLAFAPYRPGREIALAGVASAVLFGALSVAQYSSIDTVLPPHAIAIIAVLPLVVISFGSAVFASELVGGLERWQRRETMSTAALGENGSEWIARSVQQDRITLLNQEIVPYFASVLERDDLGFADRARALELSSAIRSIMVAEMDRTWLDNVLDEAAGPRGWSGELVDDAHRADAMTIDQRTVMRALIVALHALPGFTGATMMIELIPSGDTTHVVLSAKVDCRESSIKSALEPYFAVMRILFSDLTADVLQPAITLRFSYGQ